MVWAIIVLLFKLHAASPVRIESCKNAQTTLEMEQCLQHEFEAAQRRLQETEARVRTKLSPANLKLFTAAAATWRAYRDQECQSVYAESAGGSIASSALLGCEIELTDGRRSLLTRIYGPDF